jgi:hypothetical protein
VAIDEAEAGLVGALSLDGTDGERPLPEDETDSLARKR